MCCSAGGSLLLFHPGDAGRWPDCGAGIYRSGSGSVRKRVHLSVRIIGRMPLRGADVPIVRSTDVSVRSAAASAGTFLQHLRLLISQTRVVRGTIVIPDHFDEEPMNQILCWKHAFSYGAERIICHLCRSLCPNRSGIADLARASIRRRR